MSRTVICDIETNSLNPDKIWCIVAKDIETNEVFSFTPANINTFKQFSLSVSKYIGHNFLSFDREVLNKLLHTRIRVSQVTDTLILSRLFNISRERIPRIKGQHSLEYWGHKLGFLKKEHNDWSQYSPEMLEYCKQDVELNHRVYKALLVEGEKFSQESQDLEHEVQYLLNRQTETGFYFDTVKAHILLAKCDTESEIIKEEILKAFPPTPKLNRSVQVRYKKDGEMSIVGLKKLGDEALQIVGGDFSFIDWVEFNLGSPKQVVARLDKAGWKPVIFNSATKKMKENKVKHGSAKICEENLDTLPKSAPQEILKIKQYLLLTSRANNIRTWFDALRTDNRIHGEVIGLGATTHRMAHRNPNTANVPSIDKFYGRECRECWTVSDKVNRRLVGVDASGIQLRILAHYMDDPEYSKAVVEGVKEDGTDVHSVNQRAGGFDTRDVAKTFIYAWLLGAGDKKIQTITGFPGKEVREKFLAAIPALKKVQLMAEANAQRGWMRRLDGGCLQIPSAHKSLACALQAGESVIMKRAYVIGFKNLVRRKLDAKIISCVHDEWEIDCHKDHAEEAGKIMVEAIKEAGKYYRLRCPLDGQAQVGLTWADVH